VTFLLGLMPWWGWILIVLAGIGLAMFPAQVLLIARRVPLPVWGALLALLILFGAYRVGYKSAENDCKEANRAAQEAADKEAKAQEEAAPSIAQDAQDEVKPEVLERVRVIREYIEAEPVSCTAAYSDGVQSLIREAKASADNLRPVPDTKP
jgi:hypothetical protein